MNTNEEGKHSWGCRRRLWKIPFFIAAIILIKSAVVMVIWNALIPDLFHGPLLTYPQAIGLSILVKLLVGFGGHRHFGRHGGWHKGRWANLSPEEREKLKEEYRKRCGG